MSKIKVLILTHTFPTKFNPVAAIFLLNQLEELKKYCDIKVIFPHAYVPNVKKFNPYHRFSKIPLKEKIRGIEIYHPKYIMIPRILFKLKLLNFYLVIENFFSHMASKKLADDIVANWNPDIIHLHGLVSGGILGIRLKKKYDKPLLVTVYGEDVNRFAKQFPSKYFSKHTLKNSDAVICQSKFLKNSICSMGIVNKKFPIIPMGVLLAKFRPMDKNKARALLKLPKNKKIILFVGHLAPRKGVEYLVQAMKIIVKKDKNVLCYKIGKGDSEEKVKKLTSDLKLEQYIKFLGQKDQVIVAQYMNACDVFVLPSLSEGLPVVLCEAMACGKPVVATNISGTPELVTKDTGFLVKPKDPKKLSEKIESALNKKWNVKKLLARAEEFSVANSAKKLMNVYKEFLR